MIVMCNSQASYEKTIRALTATTQELQRRIERAEAERDAEGVMKKNKEHQVRIRELEAIVEEQRLRRWEYKRKLERAEAERDEAIEERDAANDTQFELDTISEQIAVLHDLVKSTCERMKTQRRPGNRSREG